MAMFTGLNTMVRGLYVNQTALNTTGHNITNADTDGYSRQSVNIITTVSEDRSSAYGSIAVGTGAEVQSVTRSRDVFADVQYRNETSTMSYYEEIATNYDKLEVIFNDSNDEGLQSKILSFYKAWVDLSTEASNASNRVNVIEQGKNLSDAITTSAQQLQEQIDYNYYYMGMNIKEVNDLLQALTQSNERVVSFEANGSTANDLRDARDLLVDKLSTYLPVAVYEDEYGNYQITSGGTTLVNGVDRLHLSLSRGIESKYFGEDFGVVDYTIVIQESNVAFQPTNGTLKANLDAVDHCKTYLDALADISGFLLTAFNDQHKQGYDVTSDDKTTAKFDWVFSYTNDITGDDYYKKSYYVYSSDSTTTDTAVYNRVEATDTVTGEVYQKYEYVGKGNGKYAITQVDADAAEIKNYNLETDTVQVPNTLNFYGTNEATYEYGYNEGWSTNTVVATYADGRRKVLTGSEIIAELMVNEPLNSTEGYMYVAAATGYDDQHDYSEYSTVNGLKQISDDEYYGRLVDWNERTGDGTNAVFLSELFNMPRDTILTAGRANAYIINKPYNAKYTTTINSLGGQSINSYYISASTQLAVDAASIDTRIGQQQSIITQVQNWRDAASGVDWNEELTNMIKYQKAFVACSRCLNAMDECLERLVSSTGAVGR